MKITTSNQDNYCIFSIQGDIDLYNASKLKVALFEAILEKKMPHLIIDMGQIPYMDSTALGALVAAHRKMKEHNGTLSIACIKDEVMEVLKLASLHRYFKIYNSVEEIIHPPQLSSKSSEEETIEVTIVDNTASSQQYVPEIKKDTASHASVFSSGKTALLNNLDKQQSENFSGKNGTQPKNANFAQHLEKTEVMVFKGWVDENTFRIPADGFPRQETVDEIERKVEAKKSAIKRAQVIAMESLVGSFRHKNWMEFHKYRRKVYANYIEIVKKGQAKLTKFDSKQNCSIIFEIKEKGLKNSISQEFLGI